MHSWTTLGWSHGDAGAAASVCWEPYGGLMIGNPLKIKDIVSELSRGGIRIPEIQRSYVWRRSQIAKLLDSIYRDFPTGSILLWDTNQEIQMREMATNLGREAR